jgi:hypothetical protein
VVYVGETVKPPSIRLREHRSAAFALMRSSPVSAWIRRLRGQPQIVVLKDEVPVADLHETECRFIEAFSAAGAPLLNLQRIFYDKSPD